MTDILDIKLLSGQKIVTVPINQDCLWHSELMSEEYIQLSFNDEQLFDMPEGTYIEYNGEKYSLLEPYRPERVNESEYRYTPKFQSKIMLWKKIPLFYMDDPGTGKETEWTTTDTAGNILDIIIRNINIHTGVTYTGQISASLTGSKTLSFQAVSIFDGLNQLANEWGTEWWVRNGVIHLSRCEYGEENRIELEIGRNIGVPSVNYSQEDYYTRFYVYGSTRNITQDYNDGSLTNHVVQKRLKLPVALKAGDTGKEVYPGGYKDIRKNLKPEEILSTTLIFDDIYPTMILKISEVWQVNKTEYDDNLKPVTIKDKDGNLVEKTYDVFYIRLKDENGREFVYNPDSEIQGKKLSIHFGTGALAGREFELDHYSEITITPVDKANLTLHNVFYIRFDETSGHLVPNVALLPAEDNEVVLFNMEMDEEAVYRAERRLEQAMLEEIGRRMSDKNTYTFKSNPVEFYNNRTDLNVGQAVIYRDGSHILETRVLKVDKQLEFTLDQNITIGKEKAKGTTQKLKEEVVNVNQNIDIIKTLNNLNRDIQNTYFHTQKSITEGLANMGNMWQFLDAGKPGERIVTQYKASIPNGLTVEGIDIGELLKNFYLKKDAQNNVISVGVKKAFFSESEISAYGASDEAGGPGSGSTTFGGLLNVGDWADQQTDKAVIAVKNAETNRWSPRTLESIVGLDTTALKTYLDENNYTDQSWINRQNFLKSIPVASTSTVGGIKVGNGLSISAGLLSVEFAGKLGTARKIWGQDFDGSADVTGALSGATTGTFSSNVSVGGTLSVTGQTTINNNLVLNNIDSRFIQIGGIRLVYDAANNALKVIKADGDPANFYATGEISAFGVSDDEDNGFASTFGGLTNVGNWADQVTTNTVIAVKVAGTDRWTARDITSISGLDTTVLADYLNDNSYATQTWVNGQNFLKSVTWSQVSEKPTTFYTLPVSSASVLGGVKVGTTLAIDSSGIINHKSGVVTAGTYIKTTVDTYGRVTAGTALTAADIPVLDTSKITTGTLPVARGGTGKSSIAAGAMYYASAANVLGEVASSSFGRGLLNTTSGTAVSGLNADLLDGLHASSFMRATNANGYYGMTAPDGSSSNWIRTTTSGIIPYQSGGASALGTSSWPFSAAYINMVYGTLSGNSSSATKLYTARTIFGKSFDGTGNVVGKAQVYGNAVAAGSGYSNGALEIREAGMVGTAQSSDQYAPRIGFHWGSRFGSSIVANSGYFKFLNQAETGYVSLYANEGRFSGVVTGSRIYAGYDSAQANSVSCSNWFRSSGATGWHNATYGGGIYMTDDKWVRTYNGKMLQIAPSSYTYGIGGHHVGLKLYQASHIGLNLANNSYTWGIYSNSNGNLYIGRRNGNTDDSSGTYYLTVGAGTMTYSGNIVATGEITAYSSSDIRLKTNVEKLSGLNLIRKTKTYSFDWTDEALSFKVNKQRKDVGFIAQEIEKIAPDFVTHDMWGKGYLGLDKTKFIPYLVAGVNELDDEVTQLKKRVCELEKRLSNYETIN